MNVPQQVPMFDRQGAIAGRDAGMASVASNAAGWSIRAAHALRLCAVRNHEFIVDEVWRYMDLADIPHDSRAMGPVLMAAAREGIILNTRRLALSDRRSSHRNPRPIWRSMVFWPSDKLTIE